MDATGIAELCVANELGKGALYHYIGSKEALLAAIHDRVMDEVLASADRVASAGGSPTHQLTRLGDELLDHGPPRAGRVRDALGPMLPSWLRGLGADVTSVRRLADDAQVLHAAVTASTADLVVTTGGTAGGPVDHVHPVLAKSGARLLVDGVAVRPGHPMLLAELPAGGLLAGLPGNPLAAVSGVLTLVAPVLRVEVAPGDRWEGYVSGRPLWLAQKRDAFASTGVQDPTGQSGRFAGYQLEGRVRRKLGQAVVWETGGGWLMPRGFLEHAPNATREGSTRYAYSDITISF